jgi:DNA-binding PadR family transcriptional regulator
MRRRNVPHGPGHPLHEAWLGHHEAFGHFGPPGRPPFPPLPPGPWGHRGRGRGRRGRGDVRAAILALLAERPMHGYEMIQELEARTGGVWRPSPGSVLIAGEEGEGRRRFTLTDAGRSEAERHGQRAPWEEVTAGVAPAAWNLRDAIAQTAQAAWSVGSAGSEAQQARALEVLNDARRRLYAILATDEQAAGDDEEAEA